MSLLQVYIISCKVFDIKKFIILLIGIFQVQDGFSQTIVVSYDFNLSDEGWSQGASALNGSWARGVAVLNNGSDGSNFWYIEPVTGDNYDNEADVSMESPILDFTSQSNMILSLDIRYQTEEGFDGFRVEYSINAGTSWTELGAVGEGINWYNDSDVDAINSFADGWSGNNDGWETAVISLPSALETNNVRFRVLFRSDLSGTEVGVAFDNFTITSGGTEIHVTGNGAEIVDGDNTPSEVDGTDFRGVDITNGSKVRTFTISNLLSSTLILENANPITLSGVNSSDFLVSAPTGPISLGSGESIDFTITFNPSALGIRSAAISIDSTDPDEDPYTFSISGEGTNDVVFNNFNSGDEGWVDVTSGMSPPNSWARGSAILTDGSDGSYWHNLNSDYSSNNFIIVESPTIDFTGLSGMVLFIDIRYDTENDFDGINIDYSNDNGASWNTLGAVGDGVNWYNDTEVDALGTGIAGWSGDNGAWQTAEVELPAILDGDSDSKFRVSFASDGSANDVGIAFDNFRISVGIPDIVILGNGNEILDGETNLDFNKLTDFRNLDVTQGIKNNVFTIVNRGGGTLNLTGPNPVSISGAHASDFNVSSQPASLSLNYLEEISFMIEFDPSVDGTRGATVSIVSNDADEGTFDFSVGGTGDNAVVMYDFDTSDDGWTVTSSTNGNWVRGTSILSTGATGSYWHTDPSTYNNTADLILQSPIIDLSGASNPLLIMDVRYDSELGNDGMKVEYSSDGGSTWNDLGQIGQGINWYNDTDIDAFANGQDGWSGDNLNWSYAELVLPSVLASNSNVRFRVLFSSDASGVDIGVAFDNFTIYAEETLLPVELVQFAGVWGNDAIDLKWITASELNNDFFEVQRSEEGKNFC